MPLKGLAGFALAACVIGYLVLAHDSQTDLMFAGEAKPIAGWENLEGCLPLQSLDGKRELIPSKDGSARLRGERPDNEMPVTTWTFDGKRYFISIDGNRKSYFLVRPKDSEVCILVRGELNSADMSESWYSRTLNDLQDDAAEASR